MLQVIKAEEVRDGEPRIWIETPQPVMHTESRRDRGCQPCGFAIVDRPAPTPAADPLATVRAALDVASKATPGPWRTGTDRLDSAEAMPHEVVAAVSGRERCLTRFDITTSGAGNAAAVVALRNAAPAIAELCAEVERLRTERDSARDSMATAHVTAAQVGDELIATRAKLAEAKRLGLEACAFVHGAIDNAPDPTSKDPGDQSAIAAGHSVADRIAAALEAL
jgi:hypothetical protein